MNAWTDKTIVVRARVAADEWTAFRRRALELGFPAEVLLGDAIRQAAAEDADVQRLRLLAIVEAER